MKKMVMAMVLASFTCVMTACGSGGGGSKPPMKSPVEKYSYMIGLDIGNSLKQLNTEIDVNALQWGLQDVLKDRQKLLTEAQLDEIKRDFSMKMQEKQMARQKEESEKNLTSGTAFLAENKKKSGVITTASGLQYEILKQGAGPSKPTLTDMVKVNYKGSTIDGHEFDNSLKHGKPAVFPVQGVIPAWIEMLPLIKTGTKVRIVVPPSLGYGERGQPQAGIGPNAVLIFEMELLAIVDQAGKEHQ